MGVLHLAQIGRFPHRSLGILFLAPQLRQVTMKLSCGMPKYRGLPDLCQLSGGRSANDTSEPFSLKSFCDLPAGDGGKTRIPAGRAAGIRRGNLTSGAISGSPGST
jgi:hypothetical protein